MCLPDCEVYDCCILWEKSLEVGVSFSAHTRLSLFSRPGSNSNQGCTLSICAREAGKINPREEKKEREAHLGRDRAGEVNYHGERDMKLKETKRVVLGKLEALCSEKRGQGRKEKREKVQ